MEIQEEELAEVLAEHFRRSQEAHKHVTGIPANFVVTSDEIKFDLQRKESRRRPKDETPFQQTLSPPKPTVTSITPDIGEPAGGTAVTIVGTNFIDDSGTGGVKSSVKIGGVACTSVVVVDDTHITCVTGRHPPSGTLTEATEDVVVYNVDLDIFGALTNGFVYEFTPTISSISPGQGAVAGGTAITVTGTHFHSGATIKIGGVSCTSVVFVNSTTLTAVTGAHAAATVDAVVTNPSGLTGTLSPAYTYRAVMPVGAAFDVTGPSSGLSLGVYYTYHVTIRSNPTFNGAVTMKDMSGGTLVATYLPGATQNMSGGAATFLIRLDQGPGVPGTEKDYAIKNPVVPSEFHDTWGGVGEPFFFRVTHI